MSDSTERLPLSGTSYLKLRPIALDGRAAGDEVSAGATPPTTMPDGWWIALFWAQDDRGVISCREAAPVAGPPPMPPLERIGALMTNALGEAWERSGSLKVRWRQPALVPVEADSMTSG